MVGLFPPPVQFKRRVCLLNSLLFGLACLVLRYGIQPRVFPPLEWLMDRHLLIPLALTLFVIYTADIVLSVRSAIQIGNRLEKLHAIQDELTEKLEALKAEQLQRQEAQKARLEFALSEARQAPPSGGRKQSKPCPMLGRLLQSAGQRPLRPFRTVSSPWANSATNSLSGWSVQSRGSAAAGGPVRRSGYL